MQSSLVGQRPFLLLQNLFLISKIPHNSLSSRCWSLLVQINVLKYRHASLNESKPLSWLQNHHGASPHTQPRFCTFLRFFNGALFLNLRITEREILTVAVQRLEEIFSRRTQIYAPGLTYWIWGANDKVWNAVSWGDVSRETTLRKMILFKLIFF